MTDEERFDIMDAWRDLPDVTPETVLDHSIQRTDGVTS